MPRWNINIPNYAIVTTKEIVDAISSLGSLIGPRSLKRQMTCGCRGHRGQSNVKNYTLRLRFFRSNDEAPKCGI